MKTSTRNCERECSHQELQDRKQFVVVSSDCTGFAGYQIAEVKLDIELRTLHFQRLRCDKRKPNDDSEIKRIIHFLMDPIDLSYIVDAALNEERDHDIKEDSALAPCQMFKSCPSSLFDIHYYINVLNTFVFDTFCGENVIDVGCGCLNALKEAYVDNVWAISNDPNRIEAVKWKAQDIEHPHIEALEINLKESQHCLCQLTEKVDSVLCYSGLHHFWDTEETTQVFLQNLVHTLKRGGLFVVTFVCLDWIPQDESTLQL
jgi:2-polyprenyl-3-methyl-5-hydroxy-6-metoxy-1,4-benzoquinol methylase